MKLTPEQLADLLSKIADHGKAQAKAFLNGDASIAGSAGTECLEFYDRWREESFPDAPMGEVVNSKQWDEAYDVYLESIKAAFQPADLHFLLIEAREALKRISSLTHEGDNIHARLLTIGELSDTTLSKLQSIKI